MAGIASVYVSGMWVGVSVQSSFSVEGVPVGLAGCGCFVIRYWRFSQMVDILPLVKTTTTKLKQC